MKNPNQRRDNGPVAKRRHDELGDSFPNDWIEALIVFVALAAMTSGAYFLHHLSTQVN